MIENLRLTRKRSQMRKTSQNLFHMMFIEKLKSISNMPHGLIFAVCFSMALYMTYLQFKYYLADEDMSPVSYRYFSDENSKIDYPTFSVCFFGSQYVFDP